MKRTEKIVLGTVGAIAVAGFFGQTRPSPEPTDAFVYESAEACRQSGHMGPYECNEEWDKASLLHLSAAEKFQDITDCEKTHGPGQCRTSAWNGLNVFIPAMAGYLISRQVASGNVITRVSQPLYPTSDAGRACQPGFDPQLRPDCTPQSNRSTSSSSSSISNRSGSSRRWFRTAAGAVIVNNGQTPTARGNTVVPRSSTQAPAVRTSVVSRGGFGATGRSMSSSS